MADRTVVLIGTLDTKGQELQFLRDRLRSAGVVPLVVDVGTLGPPRLVADITREQVAAAGGVDLTALANAGDRGRAVAAMGVAAAQLIHRLFDEGRCQGILAAGGSGNTAIATQAMQALPVGIPKLMVSTMAAGDVRDYVGTSDITMMASVTDVAGVNSISARILANAAAAMAGMVAAPPVGAGPARPTVAATMFGVTTASVTAARGELEAHGYEVITFHATGTGGRAMEKLIRSGLVSAVLDVTTTELADELVGGVLTAGPDRLEAAGRAGIPQVVSLGALDMVNFGAPESVPQQFRHRVLHAHNPTVTLMRTTAQECAELGRRIGEKLSAATGRVAVFVPLGGVSALSVPGGAFHDPAADEALFDAVRRHLRPPAELIEIDTHINDPAFAHAMAAKLAEYLEDEDER
ncbi:MAG TPA: Tm-1-like ATP-binding domain-containing protein [Jiangellales bacterium]|nr:Tm-1-like ATP-binding domain-containing protein [Jiangellales bacterium]